MTPYVDSGALIKLYVRELNSAAAARSIRRWRFIPLNAIQELEMRLPEQYTAATLARSLDIMHVAAAVAAAPDVFVTADSRQESVARKAGLRTQMIRGARQAGAARRSFA